MTGRSGYQHGQCDGDSKHQTHGNGRHSSDPPELAEAFRDGPSTSRERERSFAFGGPAALEGHGHSNHDEQDEVDQAALFEEQELHVGLGYADDQAGNDCPRE